MNLFEEIKRKKLILDFFTDHFEISFMEYDDSNMTIVKYV